MVEIEADAMVYPELKEDVARIDELAHFVGASGYRCTASARFVHFQLPADSNWRAITQPTNMRSRIKEAVRS